MFETAVVRAHTQAAPRRVGMLSASIAVHTFAGAAIIIASLRLSLLIVDPSCCVPWSRRSYADSGAFGLFTPTTQVIAVSSAPR